MKATGIVRRIDDLGRIVIPKEIRRSFRIKEGDPLEIYTDSEGEVIFKKYSPIGELSEFAGQYAEVLSKGVGTPIIITDNDHVIACSGISKREVLERRVTKNLEELMNTRQIHIKTDKVPPMSAIEGLDKQAQVVYPIIKPTLSYGPTPILLTKNREQEKHRTTIPDTSNPILTARLSICGWINGLIIFVKISHEYPTPTIFITVPTPTSPRCATATTNTIIAALTISW